MFVRSSPRLCAHLAAATGVSLIVGTLDVASAQTQQRDDRGGITGSISGGVGVAPDFEGSSDYDVVPFIFGDVNALGVRLEIQSLGARLNFRPDRPFQFGPVFSYRPGREDVSNEVVDRLEDIDDSFEAGGFVSYEFTDLFGSADSFALSAEVLADLGSGHEGWTASFGAGYGTSLGDRWRAATAARERRALWRQILEIHRDEVLTIGLVGGVPQPVVIADRLRGLPERGLYSWEPGAYFGIHDPATFWLAQ